MTRTLLCWYIVSENAGFLVCTLYIIHCTLYIVHCTLYIIHCTLYIVHCTLYIVHCTLYIVYSISISYLQVALARSMQFIRENEEIKPSCQHNTNLDMYNPHNTNPLDGFRDELRHIPVSSMT